MSMHQSYEGSCDGHAFVEDFDCDVNGGKFIQADRYKTRLCEKYIALGWCPYGTRCMFAHGERELRTAHENLRDGLVTEEAIRLFRSIAYRSRRRHLPSMRNYGESQYPDPHPYTHSPYDAAMMEEARWENEVEAAAYFGEDATYFPQEVMPCESEASHAPRVKDEDTLYVGDLVAPCDNCPIMEP